MEKSISGSRFRAVRSASDKWLVGAYCINKQKSSGCQCLETRSGRCVAPHPAQNRFLTGDPLTGTSPPMTQDPLPSSQSPPGGVAQSRQDEAGPGRLEPAFFSFVVATPCREILVVVSAIGRYWTACPSGQQLGLALRIRAPRERESGKEVVSEATDNSGKICLFIHLLSDRECWAPLLWV